MIVRRANWLIAIAGVAMGICSQTAAQAQECTAQLLEGDEPELAIFLNAYPGAPAPRHGITCEAGTVTGGFATSYSSSADSPEANYDGNLGDGVLLVGGVVVVGGDAATPLQEDFDTRLDPDAAGISTGGGADYVVVIDGAMTTASGTTGFTVDMGDGQDFYYMQGGTLAGDVVLGAGDDFAVFTAGIEVFTGIGAGAGGEVQGSITGGEGLDQVTMQGGNVRGNIEAEQVLIFGGTIGGDIVGLSGEGALSINEDESEGDQPIDLRDGVLFSGNNATGTIANTDLAAGGESQNFTGFESLSLVNSSVRLGAGDQFIHNLSVGSGASLFVDGSVTLRENGSSLGNLNIEGGSVDMRDGAADDVLTLGGLQLDNVAIGVDVDQSAALADQIVATTVAASGQNRLDVQLLGTPNFSAPTNIPIITGAGAVDLATFDVTGLPGTPASLFDFELVGGDGGGLTLRASPRDTSAGLQTQAAIDTRPPEIATKTVSDITNAAAESGLGLAGGGVLAGGGAQVQVTPDFGVFATGQFAYTEHDGFEVSGGGIESTGPSFSSNDFSAALSLDLDLARRLQLDQQYGLNVGFFGGYTSSDVDLDSFDTFDSLGNASNDSAMFGAYSLFRKDFNYLLVSASGFVGQTDIVNDALASTGSYDTLGYAVTASAGHIFVLSERVRFDLRGGILGVSFKGDEYTDSAGNDFGESKISFGALRLEPGLYADYQWSNGMVFTPYTRLTLQQRFGYENTAELDGNEFEFDDSDFSASLSGGFNLKATQRLTLSSEINGKFSSDSSQIAGKAGLKIAF